MATQFKFNFPRLLYLLLLTWILGSNTPPARAQSITAAPDGTGTIINYNGNTYHINGGTQAGANLFHSFEEFGLNPQEIANFLSNPDILNVVGRVTGGNPSIIQGLIELTGGNSNLFLMNPSGWVFTEGASLDVPGSFGATTATRIGFGDNYFNAYGDNLYGELTGNPTSLIFDQNDPSWIVNAADLAVNAGESLWLVGGGIISTGTVEAEGGSITLAAVPGKNQIELSHDGLILDLVLSAAPVEGSVAIPANATGMRAVDIPRYLTGGSEVGHANEAVVEADGTVRLVDSNTTIQEGDTVIAGEINAGNITLMAAGRVTPIGNNLMSNDPTVVLFPEAIGDTVETSFIDEGVENYETLLYGGRSGTISQVVTHQENGIDAVTETLTEIAEQGGEVSAVHLLNEGNEGEFWLGNAYVSSETISQYQAQLEQWGVALTPEADILLYACYTALGGNGIELVNTLAGLTGADVAASTNLTGSAALGGDWNLEVQTGSIEAGLGLEQWAMDDFTGKLQVFTASDAASLIAAITTANGNTQTDTINLAGNITLTAIDNATDGNNGLPSIVADGGNKLTINGMGNTISRDAAAPDFRFIHVALGADLEINETTLSGGVADPNVPFGTFFPGADGGAIYNNGTLTINNSTITGNSALDDGGAIVSYGNTANSVTVNIINSTISGNSAAGNGGGLSNTSFTGAGANSVVMNITNSTISGNSANVGGGISSLGQNANNSAVVNVNNSTISGNTAVFGGGGIYNRGQTSTLGSTVNITNSTITLNEVTNPGSSAGGILNLNVGVAANTALVNVSNSIIAGNTATAHPDIRRASATNSPVVDGGNNLIGVDDQGIFAVSTLVGSVATPLDPELAALGDYGGKTQTHGFSPSSPAFNAGNNALATESTDQRGAPGARIVGGTVDIGAFEFQGSFEILAVGDQNLTLNSVPSTLDVSVKVVEAIFNLLPSVGTTVDFSPVGTVTGSFTNGTSVVTDANGLAANFFAVASATGNFEVLAASTGLNSVTFNITNNIPNNVTVSNVTVNATNLNFLSEIEQQFDSVVGFPLARGCASPPKNELFSEENEENGNSSEDVEVLAGEGNQDFSGGNNRSCRSLEGDGGGED